jgi:Ni/Co efflux regulator RcnB
MKSLVASILAAAAVLAPLAPGQAQDNDQGKARKEMRAGNVLRLSDIEGRILPQMRGFQYLGPAYDSTAMAYRLKFLRGQQVVYVDVDARTGRVIGKSGF